MVLDIHIYIQTSVARYHGTTAAPRYHFSTVPVPSALRYYLVPQYHNYCGSSSRYFPMLTHSNEHLLDCIEFRTHCNLRLVLCRSLLNCTRFSYLFYVGQMSDGCYGRKRSAPVPIGLLLARVIAIVTCLSVCLSVCHEPVLC